ncbi:MAG: hypothetical protein EAZ13_06480 [Sphingobacteriia bacterium]|nr:MAG: hypothetical protein EAZ35_08355 [Sphingobacteriia bacterium]TAH07313.1 MAG: hypothetical protein EAZ13_06480 [Sphingobacteriia bacterium]
MANKNNKNQHMNKQFGVILFLWMAIVTEVFAQSPTSNQRYIPSISSPNGNYIYMYDLLSDMMSDSTKLASTDYFVIERRTVMQDGADSNQSDNKKMGLVRVVQNNGELNKLFSADDIVTMKSAFNVRSNADLVNYFKTKTDPRSYGFNYLSNAVKIAMGHMYIDKEVKEGEKYMYILTRVDKNKTEEPWGYTFVETKSGNDALNQLKPKTGNIIATDSFISVSWKLPLPPKAKEAVNKLIASKKSFKNLVKLLPFELNMVRAKIFSYNAQGWSPLPEMSFGNPNSTGDTLSFFYYKKTVPDEVVSCYLQLEDEVQNIGPHSDTSTSYAIDKKRLPIIISIKTEEVLDGVKINWKKLPQQPYIAGVEITKTDGNSVDTVAILSAKDSVYTDYRLKVGVSYTYNVKGLYLPQTNLKQDLPAQGLGMYTVFSKPLPPSNLVVENAGPNIALKWNYDSVPSFFGYYVYRGTSPDNMAIVGGPLKKKNYIDTSATLSGRSKYYYAVVTQNLREDASANSNMVEIVPNRKIETVSPNDLHFYFSNDKLILEWNDVRKQDDAIVGYAIKKTTVGNKGFDFLTKDRIETTTIFDSVIVAGTTYQYSIASINTRGDTSEYSAVKEYKLEKEPVAILADFTARNVEAGIELEWAAMEYPDRKLYNIYRKVSIDQPAVKIGSVTSNTFLFVDKTTQKNTSYIYEISITDTDGREGLKSNAKAVKRK